MSTLNQNINKIPSETSHQFATYLYVQLSNYYKKLLVEMAGRKKMQLMNNKYTQTKKKRPIFIVLYLLMQLRFRTEIKTKMFIKRRTL